MSYCVPSQSLTHFAIYFGHCSHSATLLLCTISTKVAFGILSDTYLSHWHFNVLGAHQSLSHRLPHAACIGGEAVDSLAEVVLSSVRIAIIPRLLSLGSRFLVLGPHSSLSTYRQVLSPSAIIYPLLCTYSNVCTCSNPVSLYMGQCTRRIPSPTTVPSRKAGTIACDRQCRR